MCDGMPPGPAGRQVSSGATQACCTQAVLGGAGRVDDRCMSSMGGAGAGGGMQGHKIL